MGRGDDLRRDKEQILDVRREETSRMGDGVPDAMQEADPAQG